MKKVLLLASLFTLSIGIWGPVEAYTGSIPSEPSFTAADRRPAKRRPRRAGRIIYGPVNPYAGNIRIIRVKRMSARQRRAVLRRLLEIQLN